MMTRLTPVLTKEDIDNRIAVLAGNISADYRGCDLVLIGILKGAFIFLSDLARQITLPVAIDFLRAESYADRSFSSGQVKLTDPVTLDIKGKDVLVVEDIIDTGLTLVSLVKYLKTLGPHSIKICTFIDKRERREVAVAPAYVAFTLEKGFLVGYGLDYAEKYRNLPGIFEVELTPSEDTP